jgi:hypothetical protein
MTYNAKLGPSSAYNFVSIKLNISLTSRRPSRSIEHHAYLTNYRITCESLPDSIQSKATRGFIMQERYFAKLARESKCPLFYHITTIREEKGPSEA